MSNKSDSSLSVKWKRIQSYTGPLPHPRHGHRAVVVKELIIIFGGGNGGLFYDLHVYNPSTQQWFVPAIRGDVPSTTAAHGMVSDGGTKVILYGGMLEYGRYSNDMYELQASRWEWKKMKPKPPTDVDPPGPRIGHSFTHHDSKIYMFGGLANDSGDPKNNVVRYLDDLYVLQLLSCGKRMAMWTKPEVTGEAPSPRESHTANVYTVPGTDDESDDSVSYLVVYGGMDGSRLGDLYMLKLEDTLSWIKPELTGNSPAPRSLHVAEVIGGNRLFIFGGWTSLVADESKQGEQWGVSSELSCLNLATNTWEELSVGPEELCPLARAGHCAVAVHSRMYMWSGRDGYKKENNEQLCLKDLWCLETARPAAPTIVQLVQAVENGLEVCWCAVPTAEAYLVQVKLYELPVPKFLAPTYEPQKILKLVTQSGNIARLSHPHVTEQPMGTGTVKAGTVDPGDAGFVNAGAVNPSMVNKGIVKVIQKVVPGPDGNVHAETLAELISVVNPRENSPAPSVVKKLNQRVLIPGVQLVSLSSPTTTTQLGFVSKSTPIGFVSKPKPVEVMPPGVKLPGITTFKANKPGTAQIALISPSPTTQVVVPPVSTYEIPASAGDSTLNTAAQAFSDGVPPVKVIRLSDDVKYPCGTPADTADKEPTGNVPTAVTVSVKVDTNLRLTKKYMKWRDVAVVKGTSAVIMHYHIPEADSPTRQNLMVQLQAGQSYKVRVAAVNACGRGKWSPISAFKTSLPSCPSPPIGVKIIKHSGSAHLAWECPLNSHGPILEYSVFIAVKASPDSDKDPKVKSDQLAFARVYIGVTTLCLIGASTLATAHVEHNINDNGKPSLIFRIAAKNKIGYGAAVQIRWVQDPNDPISNYTVTHPQDDTRKTVQVLPTGVDKDGRLVLNTKALTDVHHKDDPHETITKEEADKGEGDLPKSYKIDVQFM